MVSIGAFFNKLGDYFESHRVSRDVSALAKLKNRHDFNDALKALRDKVDQETFLQRAFNKASFRILPGLLLSKNEGAKPLFNVMKDYAGHHHDLKKDYVRMSAANIATIGARDLGSGMALFCSGRDLAVETPAFLPVFTDAVMKQLPAIWAANAAVGEEVMRHMLMLGRTYRALEQEINHAGEQAVEKLRAREKSRPFLANNLEKILKQTDALERAIVLENFKKIDELLDERANPNLFFTIGGPALHEAIERQSLRVIKALLEHRKHLEYHADVNGQNRYGDRPLHKALQENMTSSNLAIIDCLLSHYANPLLPDSNGMSALKLAGLTGNKTVVQKMKTALEKNRARYQRQLQNLSKKQVMPFKK